MRSLSISLAAVAALALSSSFAATQAATRTSVTSTPPHASKTGLMHRSAVAGRHGANARAFCPPGQAKKPGKGSAFRC
jgi:hypothetical protein